MKKFLIAALITISIIQPAKAQDAVFSQPYLSPIYLNPAATGAGDYDLRISGIYRRQWWSIPSQISYSAVSVDKFVPSLHGGFGVLGTHSTEGYLKKTGIYGSYAYTICSGTLSPAENGDVPRWFASGGLQFGVVQRRIDYSKLVFADQLDVDGIIPGSVSSADKAANGGKWYPDFSAGLFFNYNWNDNNRLLLGGSAHHINRPDESLTNTADSFRAQLPIRWTGNAMYTYTNPEQTWSYSVAGILYTQGKQNSVQVGTEITNNEYDISLGLWYRGSVNFREYDAVTLTLSINLAGRQGDGYKVRGGVAHDAPVGQNRYSYTTGSSELGFVWDQSTYDQDAGNACKPRINSKSACPIQ
ncbi:PorP/SprF family type IX secretion system membrane protein [Niastella sp. OAS944]|uniref:PorP/SprF family type IX secretion system membrane protein n=1 Tax=Niastella sp. OAS944 TaxID=2664089 RepID=UPI00349244AC|nr:type IX secretion system PorP/SprF family membrane protein [Chitinophagaceae bacterium OAS944]